MEDYRSKMAGLAKKLRVRSNVAQSYGQRMSMKDGQTTVRILPYPIDEFVAGDGDVKKAAVCRDLSVHWIGGVHEVCIYETSGDPCPICQLKDKLYEIAGKDEDDRREAYKFVPRTRFLSLVIPDGAKATKTEGTSIKYIEYGPKLFHSLQNCVELPEGEGDLMLMFEDGCDTFISKSGEGFGTTYDANMSRKTSTVDIEWLRSQEVPDLDAIAQPKGYDELLEIAQELATRYGDIGIEFGSDGE